MYDVHLEADQSLHQGDGDVGVQVVSSALEHRMSAERSPAHKSHQYLTDLELMEYQ